MPDLRPGCVKNALEGKRSSDPANTCVTTTYKGDGAVVGAVAWCPVKLASIHVELVWGRGPRP